MATGIEIRQQTTCRSRKGGRCNCEPSYRAHVWSNREPSYRAHVWSNRDAKLIRKSFASLAAAKGWRADALSALGKGGLRPPSPLTLDQAAQAWLHGAREGSIRNRSGDTYKPSAIRSYERSLRLRVLPELGRVRLTDIWRSDLQGLVDRLVGKGLDARTVQMSLLPLRAIYRYHLARDEVAVNPTLGLQLPAIRSRRDRIASPDEAGKLIEALPEGDKALWATALYAGLRRGELMALRWENVDLGGGSSTFSCDIARAVSRRLRSRCERLAPTAPQAVTVALLQTSVASLQGRPAPSFIALRECVGEQHQVWSCDSFRKSSTDGLSQPVSLSFLALEAVGRILSGPHQLSPAAFR